VLLAWVAVLLPWQRCRSECHDRLEPAVGEHACHDESCPDEPAEEHDEAHETVELLSLRPDVAADVSAEAAVIVRCFAAAPALAYSGVHAPAAPVPPVPRRTVVLLL